MRLLQGLVQGSYVLLALLGSLWLSWLLLVQVDMLYPTLYGVAGIGQTISEYGPLNHNRHGFERTDRAEHERLFSEILKAVNGNGRDLAELRYRNPSGRDLGRLLTTPEIVHLRDVTRLLSLLRKVGWAALGLWLLTSLLLVHGRRLLSPRRLAGVLLGGVGALVGIVLLLGPVRVFYKFHTWIFPAGHAWFFYYKDSLMAILMKVPDLFGYIALALLLLALVILFAGHALAWWWMRRQITGPKTGA